MTFFLSGIWDTIAGILYFFIIGRAFYIIQLYIYMGFVKDFPSTYWFTGMIDGIFTILYVVFALKGGLRSRDLFLPKKGSNFYDLI